MKINVIQLSPEYKATWWFNGITNRATEIAEWIDARNYCELHQGEIGVRCNNGDCS